MAIIKYTNIKNRQAHGEMLEQATIANYVVAIKYYVGKEQSFMKYVTRQEQIQEQEFRKNFIEFIEQNVTSKWEDVRDQILQAVQINGNSSNSYQLSAQGNVIINKIVGLSQEAKDKIIAGVKNKSSIYSVLGNVYEDFVNQLTKEARQSVNFITNNETQNLISETFKNFVQTGSLTSKSFRRENREIRSDIGLNIQKIEINDNKETISPVKTNGILKDSTETFDIELQSDITINFQKKRSTISDQDLINRYMTNNVYGMQMKDWQGNNFNNKKFTTMKTLSSRVNEIYSEVYPDVKYAGQIMYYETSRLIFDIAGIMNIGVLTGKSFIWMSKLLSDYLFALNIGLNKGDRPEVYNDEVILRRLNDLTSRNQIISSTSQRKLIEVNSGKKGIKKEIIPLTYRMSRKIIKK